MIEHLGIVEGRIKLLCDQLDIPYRKVAYFNTSTYNHFTKKFDVFLTIDKRLVVFDTSDVSEIYNDKAVSFIKTFDVLVDEQGNKYVVQRDIYASSKMLFLVRKSEERISKKTGKKYIAEFDEFDQEGYEKWFLEVFYPKHLAYIKELIKAQDLGVDINGLMLGNKN